MVGFRVLLVNELLIFNKFLLKKKQKNCMVLFGYEVTHLQILKSSQNGQ